DGRDDIGTTVSAFCPVSLSPPLVLVSLIADSYPAEVLGRVDRFAVTMLAAGQRALAGRFAVAGRPSARLLLEGVPHQRGRAPGGPPGGGPPPPRGGGGPWGGGPPAGPRRAPPGGPPPRAWGPLPGPTPPSR